MMHVAPRPRTPALVQLAARGAGLALAAMSGCAPAVGLTARPSPSGDPAPALARTATVTVANQNWADMHVYAVAGGTRYRLGVVPTFATVTFRLPRDLGLPRQLQLVAVPRAHGEPQVSQLISVSAGERLAFTVAGSAAHSTLVKWR